MYPLRFNPIFKSASGGRVLADLFPARRPRAHWRSVGTPDQGDNVSVVADGPLAVRRSAN